MGRILVSAVFCWDPFFVTFRTGEHIGETLLLGSLGWVQCENIWRIFWRIPLGQQKSRSWNANLHFFFQKQCQELLEHNFRTLKTCLLHFLPSTWALSKKGGMWPCKFHFCFKLILIDHCFAVSLPLWPFSKYQWPPRWWRGIATVFFSGPPQKADRPIAMSSPHFLCRFNTLCLMK